MSTPPRSRSKVIRIEAITDEAKLIAVGRVTANWAYYEQRVDLWLRVLLGQPAATHFPQDLKIAFKRRVRLWRDLAAVLHPEPDKQARVTRIIDKSAHARDRRDWVVHGLWTMKERIIKFGHGTKVKVEQRTMRLSTVSGVADEIAALLWDHTEFYQRYAIKLATGQDLPY